MSAGLRLRRSSAQRGWWYAEAVAGSRVWSAWICNGWRCWTAVSKAREAERAAVCARTRTRTPLKRIPREGTEADVGGETRSNRQKIAKWVLSLPVVAGGKDALGLGNGRSGLRARRGSRDEARIRRCCR
ncbi:hypothetical protein BDW22DRAFT_883351 [Trametopsis cervina]|nr:hypothetical protein BDW22DRAFT_883351 [Trametopsis cervina]